MSGEAPATPVIVPQTSPPPDVSPPDGTLVERPYRSLVKAISWRVTGTVDTVVISFLITGHLSWAVSIGAVELVTKITLYYLHERVWAHIRFGRTYVQPPEFEI